ncbi:MAG: hypothetical protein ACFB10_23925 [Salibacteraceae bacterium]
MKKAALSLSIAIACQVGCANQNSDHRINNIDGEIPHEQHSNSNLGIERTNSDNDDSSDIDSNLIIYATNNDKPPPYQDPEHCLKAIEKTLSGFLLNQRVEQIELDSLLSFLFSEIDGSYGEESTELVLQFIMDHPGLFGPGNTPSKENFKLLCFVLKEWHGKECNTYFLPQ